MTTFDITQVVEETIRKYAMFRKGDRVVVGVSGGPDSVSLLFLLHRMAPRLGISLHVAHLNHMLRQKAAQDDALFVKRVAETLGLPVTIRRMDVRRVCRTEKLSVEEAARKVRYEFFLEVARKTGSSKIAVGHNMDDQAETVLMRLLRGAGPEGLSGMSPVREIGGCKIVRPLLEVPRAYIKQFLEKERIPYKKDASNIEPVYLRNRLRLKLIPYLQKNYNRRIRKILCNTAESIKLMYEFVRKSARRAMAVCSVVENGCVQVDLRKFVRYSEAVQIEIIRNSIENVAGSLRQIDYRHIQAITKIIDSSECASVDLPGGIRIEKKGKQLIVRKKSSGRTGGLKHFTPVQLKIPGTTELPGLGLAIKGDVLDVRQEKIVTPVKNGQVRRLSLFDLKKKDRNAEYFDYDRLSLPLRLRLRRSGDRFIPIGMNMPKRLKEFFINEKVPVALRNRIPLVVSGKKIIWVCGVRMSEEAKITGGTKRVLRLTLLEDRAALFS
jgi:tRNA(Ile)-lysidine synthase